MSRLVCLDFSVGRRVRIRGHDYTVIRLQWAAKALVLQNGSTGEALEITRSELVALIVGESAELVDDLELPIVEPSRHVTVVTPAMPLHRTIDWLAKLSMVKQLLPFAGHSPKGRVFRAAYERARHMVELYFDAIGLGDFPFWSPWTLYHDLLRMRQNKFDLAALQNKGVEYRPHRIAPNSFFAEAARMAEEIRLSNPHITTREVSKRVNDRLQAASR